jgi:hypothetical protein
MGLRDAVRRRASSPGQPEPAETSLHPIKTRVIDAAFERLGAASFADLGGVWAVDAGYSFYAIDKHAPSRAALVDEDFTDAVLARAPDYPQLELIEFNFGSGEAAERVGAVDVVLLFDVLLHQVAPNWDEILELYSGRTRAFGIVNPQYIRGEETVRLLDLGRDAYLDLVPSVPVHEEIWDRIDDFDERRGRPARDVHDVWQWGIVDRDLISKMEELGFRQTYFENVGAWRGLSGFENHAFVFARE